MTDDLRERIARALARQYEIDDGFSVKQAEEYAEVQWYYFRAAADAVLDIVRPLLKDGGAFEVID